MPSRPDNHVNVAVEENRLAANAEPAAKTARRATWAFTMLLPSNDVVNYNNYPLRREARQGVVFQWANAFRGLASRGSHPVTGEVGRFQVNCGSDEESCRR
jgi:hypothetical protein